MRRFIAEDLLVIVVLLLFSGGSIALPFVDPPPFKADKLCVLVVEKTADRESLPKSQVGAMVNLTGIRGYVSAKKGEYILWDKDQQWTKESVPWVEGALAARKEQRTPWIVAADPQTGFSQELPQTEEQIIALLKGKFGP